MATKGKQLRFNQEREREILLLLRQARAKGVGVFLRGHSALDDWVARELVTVHPDLFAGLSKKSAGDLIIEQHRKRENWSRKQSGTNEQSNTSNTGLFIQLIKANWNGAERLAAASSTPHVRRRRRSSSSSRSLSSCAVRRWAVSWSICSWTRRWLVLNHKTVKQTRQTDQRNAKQFSSTASDATPPAVL